MEQDEVPAFKKGPWTPSEDDLLLAFVREHGVGNWNTARLHYPGLQRYGKSCRLRYFNQLQKGLRKDPFTTMEERVILMAHAKFGNQWSKIAALLPGRTDNAVKNYWNMRRKRLKRQGLTAAGTSHASKLHASPLQCCAPGSAFSNYQCSWPTACSSSSSPAAASGATDYWGNYVGLLQTQGSNYRSLLNGYQQASTACLNPQLVELESPDLTASFLYDHNHNTASDLYYQAACELPSVQTTYKPIACSLQASNNSPSNCSFNPVHDRSSSTGNIKDLLEAMMANLGASISTPKCTLGADNVEYSSLLLGAGAQALLEEHSNVSSSSWSSNPSVQCIDQSYPPKSAPINLVDFLEQESASYCIDGTLDSVVLSSPMWNNMPGAYNMATSPLSGWKPHAY